MPINHPAVATAGVVAISVAVAAAIAIYESPELRRMADDLRRKIALAFHSFGDVIEPNQQQQPLFNRPEDAEGFLQSRGSVDPGVVADQATLQRQREELMYWNALRLEKQARELMDKQKEMQEKKQQESITDDVAAPPLPPRRTTFDDFLSPDIHGDRGTFVYNTGASVRPEAHGLVYRRPVEQYRGLQASILTDPFGDEHQISDSLISPPQDEIPEPVAHRQQERPYSPYGGSDIYDISTPKRRPSVSAAGAPPASDVLTGASEALSQHDATANEPSVSSSRSVTVGHSPEPMARDLTASPVQNQAALDSAFSQIQAWAQSQHLEAPASSTQPSHSNPSFYSPIPVSPAAPLSEVSEPDVISRGDLTPTDTDSISLAGTGEEVSRAGSRAGLASNFDVMSESDGMVTPASWTEVGSVVSEDDHPPLHA